MCVCKIKYNFESRLLSDEQKKIESFKFIDYLPDRHDKKEKKH